MAVTKIKPIRGTVNKALAYILDPKKTDDELYVSSYGCAASDAAAKEFEWTRNLAVQQGMQMPKVIARHLIQSFDVGEVTPEQAHEIGKQFADEWLKGKYEYVIATHIDKGHCHNHIICAPIGGRVNPPASGRREVSCLWSTANLDGETQRGQ